MHIMVMHVFVCSALHCLSMAENSLGVEASKALAEVLLGNTAVLTDLNLNTNDIGPKGAAARGAAGRAGPPSRRAPRR